MAKQREDVRHAFLSHLTMGELIPPQLSDVIAFPYELDVPMGQLFTRTCESVSQVVDALTSSDRLSPVARRKVLHHLAAELSAMSAYYHGILGNVVEARNALAASSTYAEAAGIISTHAYTVH